MRDVAFDEQVPWSWDAAPDAVTAGASPSMFTVEYQVDNTAVNCSGAELHAGCRTSATPGPREEPQTPSEEPQMPSPSPVQFVSPPTGEEVDAEGVPLRFRTVAGVTEHARPVTLEYSGLCLVAVEEPADTEQALGEACWKEAMDAEIKAITDNETWEFAELPRGHRAIGLKWVYKVKKDPQGNVVKHKAHLVAKGFAQRQGIDFDEVFAPVAWMETVRVLIALAAHGGWEVHHMDVKSAFLNGELAKEVYVQQPPGYVDAGHGQSVLRLQKALYGLRQAPRAWNSKLDATLLELGFKRSPLEHAVYRKRDGDASLLVGVYVDDLIITGSRVDKINEFKVQMMEMFKMSDLGLLSYYLGIEVEQSRSVITLCQSSYARKIVEDFGMKGCNPCSTPMENWLCLSKNDGSAPVDATAFWSVVGSLRYLVNTRPDIAHAVGIISRYMEAPSSQHLAAMKHILRYISATADHGLCYEKHTNGVPKLVGYSDSDHAGDINDRKSTSGILFFLGGSPISWAS